MEIIKYFEGNQVRIVTDENGTRRWVAKDVCDVLELTNISKALQCLDEDEKGITTSYTLGGPQKMLTVTEPGLFALLLNSRKPEARKFRRWVLHEVLPEIITTGSYIVQTRDPIEKAQIAYNACLKMAGQFDLQGNQAKLAANRATRQLTGIDPMELLGVEGLVSERQEPLLTPSDIGQRLGLSASGANRLLEDYGLQVGSRDFRDRLIWKPAEAAEGLYQWLDVGKQHGDGTPVMQLKWYESVLDVLRAEQLP